VDEIQGPNEVVDFSEELADAIKERDALKQQLADTIAMSDAKLQALEGQRNEALNRACIMEAQLRVQAKGTA
jgi:hypothetical protein